MIWYIRTEVPVTDKEYNTYTNLYMHIIYIYVDSIVFSTFLDILARPDEEITS